MALTTTSVGTIFTKFYTVTFTTDLVGKKEITFGDGITESFEGTSVTHIYENAGNFKACVKACSDTIYLVENCVYLTAVNFVPEVILLSEPLSAYASDESGLFSVSLSSSCPPPFEVELFVDKTISEYSITPSTTKPRHYFFKDDVPLESTVIKLDDPSTISVGGEVVGYHDKFCFGYYDDFSGEFEIKAVLAHSCNTCLKDYVEVSLSSIDCDFTEYDAVGDDVWVCRGDGELYKTSYDSFLNVTTTEEIVTDSTLRINAMAYNSVDGFIYAVFAGAGAIIKIDPNTGITTRLTANNFVENNTVVGLINPVDGFYYCKSFSSTEWKVCNLSTLTLLPPLTETSLVEGADAAYDTLTNLAWIFWGSNVYSIDLTTGQTVAYPNVIDFTTSPSGGVNDSGQFGGMFSDASGYVAGVDNSSGNIFAFRPVDLLADPTVKAVYITTSIGGVSGFDSTADVIGLTGLFNGFVIVDTDVDTSTTRSTQLNICKDNISGATTQIFEDDSYLVSLLDGVVTGVEFVLDKFDGDLITHPTMPPQFTVVESSTVSETKIVVTSNTGDMLAADMSECLSHFYFTSNGIDNQNRTIRASMDTGFGSVETAIIQMKILFEV